MVGVFVVELLVADSVEAGGGDAGTQPAVLDEKLDLIRRKMTVEQGKEVSAGEFAEVVRVVDALARLAGGILGRARDQNTVGHQGAAQLGD